jgi:hypothetical protein
VTGLAREQNGASISHLNDDNTKRLRSQHAMETYPEFTVSGYKDNDNVADRVLIVRGVSRNLISDDFLRMVPASMQVKGSFI